MGTLTLIRLKIFSLLSIERFPPTPSPLRQRKYKGSEAASTKAGKGMTGRSKQTQANAQQIYSEKKLENVTRNKHKQKQEEE